MVQILYHYGTKSVEVDMRNLNGYYRMKVEALKEATGIEANSELTRTMINEMIKNLSDVEAERFKKAFDKLSLS